MGTVVLGLALTGATGLCLYLLMGKKEDCEGKVLGGVTIDVKIPKDSDNVKEEDMMRSCVGVSGRQGYLFFKWNESISPLPRQRDKFSTPLGRGI